MASVIKVGVTGGAGQIGYSLLFRIASGEMFGQQQKVSLHLLELEAQLHKLEGVKMELDDCAFPLLHEVQVGSDPKAIFADIDYALLVGAKPRTKGMERSDLLMENAHIFQEVSSAIDRKDICVLVVGNPCNTNALVLAHNTKHLPKENIRAMTRLDQNRAKTMIAKKVGATVSDVDQVGIWGNHSPTMVVDYQNIVVRNQPLLKVLQDMHWLQKEFLPAVQTRGAKVIEARGASSAASAANAIIDSIRDWHQTGNHFFSAAIFTEKNNPYGIQEGLFFSFLLRSQKIVEGLVWDDFLQEKIRETEKELAMERDMVKNFL